MGIISQVNNAWKKLLWKESLLVLSGYLKLAQPEQMLIGRFLKTQRLKVFQLVVSYSWFQTWTPVLTDASHLLVAPSLITVTV